MPASTPAGLTSLARTGSGSTDLSGWRPRTVRAASWRRRRNEPLLLAPLLPPLVSQCSLARRNRSPGPRLSGRNILTRCSAEWPTTLSSERHGPAGGLTIDTLSAMPSTGCGGRQSLRRRRGAINFGKMHRALLRAGQPG